MTDKLLNSRELAEFLGVSTYWIKEKRQAGLIPYLRLFDRLIRFRTDDVMAALEARQTEGESGGKV